MRMRRGIQPAAARHPATITSAIPVLPTMEKVPGSADRAGELWPDVVLLDIRMPDVDGLSILPSSSRDLSYGRLSLPGRASPTRYSTRCSW